MTKSWWAPCEGKDAHSGACAAIVAASHRAKCFAGRRFDEFVNIILEDATEYETTAAGRAATRLEQILLNGNNICMLVPGAGPE